MNFKLRFGEVKTRRNPSKTSLTSSRHNLRRLIRRSKIKKVTNRRICDAYTDFFADIKDCTIIILFILRYMKRSLYTKSFTILK